MSTSAVLCPLLALAGAHHSNATHDADHPATMAGTVKSVNWTKQSLRPGDHAVFRFSPLRDGGAAGYLKEVTLPSGQELNYNLAPAEK